MSTAAQSSAARVWFQFGSPILLTVSLVLATVGCDSGTKTVVAPSDTLVSIEVTPTNPSIAMGTGQQLVAMGMYEDNSTKDVSSLVTWSSAMRDRLSVSLIAIIS